MTKKIFTKAKLSELVLDINNPRFAELYNGSNNEEDLIEYLLYTESADEIVNSIVNADEFYPDRPLWVIKRGDKYLIKDGNRRCAAAKALQCPQKYRLSLSKFLLKDLPVLIYSDGNDLEKRKIQEHTANLFKKWDRIAKALEIYRLYFAGSSIESMEEIDSNPTDLIKLSSFYYEAVKVGGEDLKKLLRRGRGKTGGKTIIFERLFKYKQKCGYDFGRKPNYRIIIKDQKQFESYIKSLVQYLQNNPQITHKYVDDNANLLFENLAQYGFSFKREKIQQSNKIDEDKQDASANNKRKSVRNKPVYYRKQLPKTLEKLIKEYYDLDHINFANAKTSMSRVVFECILKYVIDNTIYDNTKNKALRKSQYFKNSFYDKNGKELQYTNFSRLKTQFESLIIDTKSKKAFQNFDLEKPNQIIHNYTVCALPSDADALASNLIHLISFLLQEEGDLLNSLNLTKL